VIIFMLGCSAMHITEGVGRRLFRGPGESSHVHRLGLPI
jgi:hypothetical protein